MENYAEQILFLDLDGVLNIASGPNITFKKQENHFEEYLVDHLKILLLELPNLGVVISSSWRNDLQDMLSELQKAGFKTSLFNRIVSVTPHCSNSSKETRLKEINMWLEDSKFKGKYLILDDELDLESDNHILKIDPSRGFDIDCLSQALKYFKKD